LQRRRAPKCLTSSRKVQINSREKICATIVINKLDIKYIAVIGHMLQEVDYALERALIDEDIVGGLDAKDGIVGENEDGVKDGFMVKLVFLGGERSLRLCEEVIETESGGGVKELGDNAGVVCRRFWAAAISPRPGAWREARAGAVRAGAARAKAGRRPKSMVEQSILSEGMRILLRRME
jgi:hypothetical protein